MYAAVVLTKESRNKLLEHPEVVKRIGNEDTPLMSELMEPIAHHMTVVPNLKTREADWWRSVIPPDRISLEVTDIGGWLHPRCSPRITPSLWAVRVKTNVWTRNQTPHITLAINREDAKDYTVWPSHSNLITKWTPIKPITLKGYMDVCE